MIPGSKAYVRKGTRFCQFCGCRSSNPTWQLEISDLWWIYTPHFGSLDDFFLCLWNPTALSLHGSLFLVGICTSPSSFLTSNALHSSCTKSSLLSATLLAVWNVGQATRACSLALSQTRRVHPSAYFNMPNTLCASTLTNVSWSRLY